MALLSNTGSLRSMFSSMRRLSKIEVDATIPLDPLPATAGGWHPQADGAKMVSSTFLHSTQLSKPLVGIDKPVLQAAKGSASA